MNIRFLAALAIFILMGCDQDPFGLSYKKLAGQYSLHQFESGDYYVVAPGAMSGGGVLEGTVQEIGWNKDLILARRKANFGGDKSGWMVIDVAAKTVSGPISDEIRFQDLRYSTIVTTTPEDAWKR